jgi:hypothetical protein
MVLDSASRNLAIKAKGEGRDNLPFFFMIDLNKLADGAFVGQIDMDEKLLNLGGFNRSSPLRAKILDTALVPQSAQAMSALYWPLFQCSQRAASSSARTMFVQVPPYACHSNVPEQSGGVLRRPVESTLE